ncbi:MAG: hypothetical protein WDN24_06195 [Sphingomonas sp.]
MAAGRIGGGEAAGGRPEAGAGSEWTAASVYTLGFLTLISTFNYLDRSILGLVLPLIKAEMQVSDTVLGLVSGPSSSCSSIRCSEFRSPGAADRYSRRNIIAIGLAFWSAMTAMTGLRRQHLPARIACAS